MTGLPPPLHPFLVHFPVALWLTGTLILLVATIRGKRDWEKFAWLLFALATLGATAAAYTGREELALLDTASLELLGSHGDWGNALPWLMGGGVLVKTHLTLTKREVLGERWGWCAFSVVISIFVLYTSHLGGSLVYSEVFIRATSR